MSEKLPKRAWRREEDHPMYRSPNDTLYWIEVVVKCACWITIAICLLTMVMK